MRDVIDLMMMIVVLAALVGGTVTIFVYGKSDKTTHHKEFHNECNIKE